MELESVINRYQDGVPTIEYREPQKNELSRWRQHLIGGRSWQVIQPVTFTPYASTQPCSGRCRFCSENLREKGAGRHASLLRPSSDYFPQLQRALNELRGLPLSYSLSGLEMTDDRQWFLHLLAMLVSHGRVSPVERRVLYSNAAGLLSLDDDAELMGAMTAFEFSWVELSRHHDDPLINQEIMRFRTSTGVSDQKAFANCVVALQRVTEVKLVCIVQSGGVDSIDAMLSYLSWARSLGVRHVIFRELSILDQRYRENATFRYVAESRVSIAHLMRDYLERDGKHSLDLQQSTYGYYYRNLVVKDNGLCITFESSDYTLLHEKHDSGRVYKLVFHANGNLCADWNPARHILLSPKA